jgi:hypothetical protein
MILPIIWIYLLIGFFFIKRIYEKLPQINNIIQALIIIFLWPYYLIYTFLKQTKNKKTMKNVIFAIAISALFLSSCGTGSTPAEVTSTDSVMNDSVGVMVDTTLIDTAVTVVIDSVKK